MMAEEVSKRERFKSMRKTQRAGFEYGGGHVRRNTNSLKLRERILANSQQEMGTSDLQP